MTRSACWLNYYQGYNVVYNKDLFDDDFMNRVRKFVAAERQILPKENIYTKIHFAFRVWNLKNVWEFFCMVALTAKKNDPEDLAENTARSALLLSLRRTRRFKKNLKTFLSSKDLFYKTVISFRIRELFFIFTEQWTFF